MTCSRVREVLLEDRFDLMLGNARHVKRRSRRDMWKKASQFLLLAFLAGELYFLALLYPDVESVPLSLLYAVVLPMLVGALVQAWVAVTIPIGIGVLLVLTVIFGDGDTGFWLDPLAVFGFVQAAVIEAVSVAIGILLGRSVMRRL